MHYVSDTTRYGNIVFIGFQLVLAYIERLMSTVNVKYQCQCKLILFSRFGVEVNWRNWVCKLRNILLTGAETEAISIIEGF